jgi:lipopolysaccharide export system permease protein
MGVAVGISTFVVVVGFFAKSAELLSKGISLEPLLLFVLYKTPQLLAYTIPAGLLAATVMVFNRMSADNEITALRAGGVSLLQVVAPLLLLSLGLSGVCLYLTMYASPEYSYRGNYLIREKVVGSILELLKEDDYNELGDGVFVYFESREGDQLRNVRMFRFGETGTLQEDLTAARGRITLNLEDKTLELHLENVIIVVLDEDAPYDPEKMGRMVASEITLHEDYGESLNKGRLIRKFSNMTAPQLIVHMREVARMGRNPTRPLVDLHKRAALAMAPFTFMLLGIPLGIRVARKENYTGLFAALLICALYFGTIALVENQYGNPRIHPELLIWLPNIVGQTLGFLGIWLRR